MNLSELREQHEAVEHALKSSGKREGGKLRALCPFCTSSKTGRADYSLGCTPSTGLYYCHRCEVGGKLKNLLDDNEDGWSHLDESGEDVFIGPPDGFIPLWCEPALSAESLAPARAYCAKRNMPREMCKQLGVGAVLDGYYSGRIIIPNLQGEDWLGWVARDWTGRAEKKYLYPKGLSRGRFWNHEAAEVQTAEPLIVVEGVLDAVPFWPDAVAMLGKLTMGQQYALKNTTRPVALVWDGDAWLAARAKAMELRWLNANLGQVGWVKLPPRTDPDELDPAWVRQRARECIAEPL
jgi:hypothetical protein